MDERSLTKRLMASAVAGAAGTLVLQAVRSETGKRFPRTTTPMKQDPGEFMVEAAKSRLPDRVSQAIPQRVDAVAARSLALGYGLTFAAAYAALRPRPKHLLLEGAVLGLATWAAGYLGWLPATGLTPPVTAQTRAQVLTPPAQHLAFGLVVVFGLAAMYRASMRDDKVSES